MNDLKLFVVVLAIFFCSTEVQQSHIYFKSTPTGTQSTVNKIMPRLPRIELEANLEDIIFIDNKKYTKST